MLEHQIRTATEPRKTTATLDSQIAPASISSQMTKLFSRALIHHLRRRLIVLVRLYLRTQKTKFGGRRLGRNVSAPFCRRSTQRMNSLGVLRIVTPPFPRTLMKILLRKQLTLTWKKMNSQTCPNQRTIVAALKIRIWKKS